MRKLVVFAHGKESGPWGSKISALAALAGQAGASVLSIDFSDLNSPDARVARLLATPLPEHDTLLLVGSSMGGYVVTVGSETLKPDGLFLMAPALYRGGYDNQQPHAHACHVGIVHGWSDAVIPVASSIAFAQQHRCELHLIDGDHRLNAALPTISVLFRNFMEARLGWGQAGASAQPAPVVASAG